MKTVGTLFLLAATTASVAAAVASATPPALPALDASLFAAAELQMCAAGCRLLGSPELVAFAAAVEAMPNEFANLHITREEGQEPQLVIFGPSGEVLYRRAVEHMSGAALEALLASFGFVRGGAAERRADASPGTGASTVLARHTALRAKALAAAAAADVLRAADDAAATLRLRAEQKEARERAELLARGRILPRAQRGHAAGG